MVKNELVKKKKKKEWISVLSKPRVDLKNDDQPYEMKWSTTFNGGKC